MSHSEGFCRASGGVCPARRIRIRVFLKIDLLGVLLGVKLFGTLSFLVPQGGLIASPQPIKGPVPQRRCGTFSLSVGKLRTRAGDAALGNSQDVARKGLQRLILLRALLRVRSWVFICPQ